MNEMTIREAYDLAVEANGREWVKIALIQELTGWDRGRLHTEILNSGCLIEQEPFGHRVTGDDRRYAIHRGGEDMHLIRF
jgi:hypothetical protein